MKPGSLVSVVIPTYNRARTLRRAVESVLRQSYTNLELIVVDDASTDDTKAVLSSINDPRMRVITYEFNRGCAAARNIGARDARGEYLAFQDSDDEWLADKLSKQVAA
ncbi:MAG: glycosyltransferase family 2 protein, partial [Henriciella sp.]